MSIFISYNHNDRDYVKKLYETLQKQGFDAWFDDLIDYGENWGDNIKQKLETCEAVIVILTPNSISSPTFQAEIRLAELLKKKIIPVLLQDINENPLSLLRYVDVRGGELPPEVFYQQLETAGIHSRLAGDSTTDAPPPEDKKKKKGKR